LLSSLLVTLLAQTAAPAPARVTLIFGGDVIPHDPVKYVAAMHRKDGDDANNEGWDHVFGPLAPALTRADFAVVNLETPIVVVKKPEKGEMTFNAQPPLLAGLKRAGVDIATFANNHCLDQHREGITSTRDFLADAGILTAGAGRNAEEAWTPIVVEKDGLKIGILAVSRWLNGYHNKKDEKLPHVPTVPYPIEPIVGGKSIDDFMALIRDRAAEVDALIVSIHWGAEYKFAPAPEDRKLAQMMIDAGAFAVIGHHPHVLQPVEFLERSQGGKGLVVFSLGNLVSNQDFDKPNGTKRDGLLVELEIVRETADGATRLESVRAIPVAGENTLGKGKARNVQALLLDDELAAIEERLTELADRTDAETKKERKALEERRKIGRARRERIAGFVAAEMLDKATPQSGYTQAPQGGVNGQPISIPSGAGMPIRPEESAP
jgi:poly-gamma-glutamate synthesis protein (capsule biosynthesis protein)